MILVRTIKISLRLFGRLMAVIGFCSDDLTCTDVSMMDQCFLTMPLTLGRSGLYVMTNGRTALFAAVFWLVWQTSMSISLPNVAEVYP